MESGGGQGCALIGLWRPGDEPIIGHYRHNVVLLIVPVCHVQKEIVTGLIIYLSTYTKYVDI